MTAPPPGPARQPRPTRAARSAAAPAASPRPAAPHSPGPEAGMVLVTVLGVLALAATTLMVLLALQQGAIQRGQRFGEAAQALAWARGGEASVAAALRRDGVEAPGIDHLDEPWARTAQTPVAIPDGQFALRLTDANARLNLNALADGGALGLERLLAVTRALELDDTVAARALALIRLGGPLGDLGDLAAAGVTAEQIAALDGLVTALPGRAPVNLNSAGADLLGLLLGNRAAGQRLVARRAAQGFLGPQDVAQARVVLPPGLGFTSNLWWVEATVTTGGTTQTLRTLLHRRPSRGRVEVVAIRRDRPTPSQGTDPSPTPPG